MINSIRRAGTANSSSESSFAREWEIIAVGMLDL